MRIDASAKCTIQPECDNTYTPIPLQTTKSLNVDKTNTLHQFDTAGIIGLPSPVGKIPLVFYIKEYCGGGRRGIIYYDDYDSVCFMYPEHEHAEWCKQPYDMKYDKIEEWSNEIERGWWRNYGIFRIYVSVLRKWYNGEVSYRPRLKIQGCGGRDGGYPRVNTIPEKTVATKVRKIYKPNKKKHTSGCGCGKG